MKVLLLNSTYEGISFVNIKRALKLYFNDKVEILSSWDEQISWSGGKMNLPAVIRLKYFVRWIPKRVRLNRNGVFRRDGYQCMYCGIKKVPLTIDHVYPKSRGGERAAWTNVTTCCLFCNSKKGNRTPEEAGMRLIAQPFIPGKNLYNETLTMTRVHDDWKIYLGR